MPSNFAHPLIPEERLKLHLYGWLADHHGCGYYRIKMPLMAMRKKGYTVTIDTKNITPQQSYNQIFQDVTSPTSYLDNIMPSGLQRNELYGAMPDVFIGQRVCMESPSGFWQRTVKRKTNRPMMVFEVDDDLLNIDPTNRKAYEVYRQNDVRERFINNMVVADKVTVSTPYLADEYKKYNRNIYAVPNTIPTKLIETLPQYRTDGKITVGWAGSPTHHMDWVEVAGTIGNAISRNPNAEMHMVGWNYADGMGISSEQFRSTEWMDSIPNYWKAIDFHIGLAPLKDHKFNWSKSHLKALEYNALGIPVIASNVGPYRDFVKHGETGFLAKNLYDWYDYINMLVTDHDLREYMGANARQWARQWTIERWSNAWEHTLTTT